MSRTADRVHCRKCNQHRDLVGPISHSGQCHGCGYAAMEQNLRSLHFKVGREELVNWRRKLAASIGAVLLEDIPAHLEQREKAA